MSELENTSTEELKAIAEHNPAAQFQLGSRYFKGEGVTPDTGKGVECYCMAALSGYAEAQYQIGMIFNGIDEENQVSAAFWFRKAAEQGHVEAQYQTGKAFFKGLGVEKDPVQALPWFRRAAEQGHAAAQFCLGGFYATGLGGEKDMTQAKMWLQKAEEQGLPQASELLQTMDECASAQ